MKREKAQKIYEKRMEQACLDYKDGTATAYMEYETAIKPHREAFEKAKEPFREKLKEDRKKAQKEYNKNVGLEI